MTVQDEYKELIAIEKRTGLCPVWNRYGISNYERFERCAEYRDCEKCVQQFLREKQYDTTNKT